EETYQKMLDSALEQIKQQEQAKTEPEQPTTRPKSTESARSSSPSSADTPPVSSSSERAQSPPPPPVQSEHQCNRPTVQPSAPIDDYPKPEPAASPVNAYSGPPAAGYQQQQQPPKMGKYSTNGHHQQPRSSMDTISV